MITSSIAQVNKFLQFVCVTDTAYLRSIVKPEPEYPYKLKQPTKLPIVERKWSWLNGRLGYLAVVANWCNDNDISLGGKSFTVEFDKDSKGNTISPKQQIQWMTDAGLPYSLAVFTGGKSVHFWVVLEQPVEELKWKALVNGYLSKLSKVAGIAKPDDSSLKIGQPYRLPCVAHQDTGKQSEILEDVSSWQKFTYDELEHLAAPVTLSHSKSIIYKSELGDSVTNANQAEATVKYTSLDDLRKAYEESDYRDLYDATEAESCASVARKHFKTAEANKGGVHAAILSAATSSCVYALVHGVDATVDMIYKRAKETYAKLERPSDREADDKRTICDGLSYALANLKQELDGKNTRQFTGKQVTVDWVSDMSLNTIETKVIAVKSITGTGKTTAIAAIVNELPSDSRVLVLSHRVLLVAQWLGDLSGFIGYSEGTSNLTSLRSIPHLICSYDSAHKLRGATYDYVILDEPDQAFPHALLGNTSIRSVRRQMAETLRCLLYKATKVFLTSAHLTDLELELVTTLAETQQVTAIENLKKPEPRTYHKYGRRKEALEALHKMLLSGKRCFVAADSATEVRKIAEGLSKVYPDKKLMTITRDNDDKEAMENANEYLKGYDCVIASPTMGTGVNISSPDLFHCVFGFFVNSYDPIGYLDLVQAVNRVRHPIDKSYHVFVSPITPGIELTKDELAQQERVNESNIEQWMTLTKEGTFAPIAEGAELYGHIQKWQASYLWRQQQESRQRYAKFWRHVKGLGHKITRAEHSDEGLEKYKKETKEIAEVIKQREYEAVASAKDITKQEAKELLKTRVKTKEQKLALDKFTIRERLQLKEVTVDDVEYYRKRGQKLSTLLWLSNMTADEAMAKDAWTIAQYSYDRTRYQEQRVIVLELMQLVNTIVSRCKGEFTVAEVSDWCEWQEANVQNLRDLGIKVDTSKPALALTETLKLMEFTVDSRLQDVTLSRSKSSSYKSKLKDSVTQSKGKREQTRLYSYYRTPQQQKLWERLVSSHKQEQNSSQLLDDFLSCMVTAFTLEHVRKYLGDQMLLEPAMIQELASRGYTSVDGVHYWNHLTDEEHIEEAEVA